MKGLFIIAITLFFLISLLKKTLSPEGRSITPPLPVKNGEDELESIGRKVLRNQDVPSLWAEWGAATYARAVDMALDSGDPLVKRAEERFRTAASLAPDDASIALDWAKWRARIFMDDDDTRMNAYRSTVDPLLRKAARLAPERGDISYEHAELLWELAGHQYEMMSSFEEDDAEYARLWAEADALAWDGIDLAEKAERQQHNRLDCLALRAGLFLALAEERLGGEEKYLLEEAGACLSEYKRLGGGETGDESYIASSLEQLRGERSIRPARPVAAPAEEQPASGGSGAPIPAAAPVREHVRPEAPKTTPAAQKEAVAPVPVATPDVQPEPSSAPLPATPADAVPVVMPPALEFAAAFDFRKAAEALAPPMPVSSPAAGGSMQASPVWDAPAYSVPDYARPKEAIGGNAPGGGVYRPVTTGAEAEKNAVSEDASVGSHRALSYRPIGG